MNWLTETKQRLMNEGVKLFLVTEGVWYGAVREEMLRPTYTVTIFYPDYEPGFGYENSDRAACESFGGEDSWEVVERALKFINNGYKTEVDNNPTAVVNSPA